MKKQLFIIFGLLWVSTTQATFDDMDLPKDPRLSCFYYGLNQEAQNLRSLEEKIDTIQSPQEMRVLLTELGPRLYADKRLNIGDQITSLGDTKSILDRLVKDRLTFLTQQADKREAGLIKVLPRGFYVRKTLFPYNRLPLQRDGLPKDITIIHGGDLFYIVDFLNRSVEGYPLESDSADKDLGMQVHPCQEEDTIASILERSRIYAYRANLKGGIPAIFVATINSRYLEAAPNDYEAGLRQCFVPCLTNIRLFSITDNPEQEIKKVLSAKSSDQKINLDYPFLSGDRIAELIAPTQRRFMPTNYKKILFQINCPHLSYLDLSF